MQDPEKEARLQQEREEKEAILSKLAGKFGKNTRTGGKGSQRRKKKVVPKGNKNEDVRILSALKKYGLQSLPEIDELNMFKDDNTVIHMKKPAVQIAVKESFVYVSGQAETKDLRDLMPGILNQVGPQQYESLKEYQEKMEKEKETTEEAENDDEIPDLVDTNFEEASKKE